jgi:hypothetical protein
MLCLKSINDVILFAQYKIDKPVNEEEEEEDEDDEDGFRAGRGKKDEEEDDPVASESFHQNTAFLERKKSAIWVKSADFSFLISINMFA